MRVQVEQRGIVRLFLNDVVPYFRNLGNVQPSRIAALCNLTWSCLFFPLVQRRQTIAEQVEHCICTILLSLAIFGCFRFITRSYTQARPHSSFFGNNTVNNCKEYFID